MARSVDSSPYTFKFLKKTKEVYAMQILHAKLMVLAYVALK